MINFFSDIPKYYQLKSESDLNYIRKVRTKQARSMRKPPGSSPIGPDKSLCRFVNVYFHSSLNVYKSFYIKKAIHCWSALIWKSHKITQFLLAEVTSEIPIFLISGFWMLKFMWEKCFGRNLAKSLHVLQCSWFFHIHWVWKTFATTITTIKRC